MRFVWLLSIALAPVWADSAQTVQVTLSNVTFTATSSACLICTETMDISFDLTESLNSLPSFTNMVIDSQGFLGAILIPDPISHLWIPFSDSSGGPFFDEIDLNSTNTGSISSQFYLALGGNSIVTGGATGGFMNIFYCSSTACRDAYDIPSSQDPTEPFIIRPTSGTIRVTRLPEGGSTLSFLAFDLFILAIPVLWRSRALRKNGRLA